MKLILSIVNGEDANRVIDKLNKNKFSVTKLCSTGGFLRSGNTTLLVGVDEDKIDAVIEIIRKESRSRKQLASAPIAPDGIGGVHSLHPVEVIVGGATIFVMDVERFEKL